MFKAIVLVTTLCATLAAASERDTRINNRFALTVARRDALRQKYNLGEYAHERLAQDSTDSTSTNKREGLISCARGLASGLQFS
jgi:hypothetical protein